MEKQVIDAVRRVLPWVDVYHDYAPEEAALPLIVVQRVGGGGGLFIDHHEPGGYQVRFSVSVWDKSRLESVEKSRALEKSLLDLPTSYAVAAADAVYLHETGAYGMVQDFVITE